MLLPVNGALRSALGNCTAQVSIKLTLVAHVEPMVGAIFVADITCEDLVGIRGREGKIERVGVCSMHHNFWHG